MSIRRKFTRRESTGRVKIYEKKVDSFPNSPDKNQIRKFIESDGKFPDLQGQMRKSQSIRELMSNDKKKLPSLKESWHNTRDVSHLKDMRETSINHTYLNLPTDIESLYTVSQEKPKKKPKTNTQKDNLEEFDTIERLLLGNPTGRQEIENLAKWFAMMKEKYINKNKDPNHSALIYKVCLKEIIRQVAVHCLDRGKLLREVVEGFEILQAENEQKLINSTEEKIKAINEELQNTKAMHDETVEQHEKTTISLYDKISEYVKDINKTKDSLRQTELSLEQKNEEVSRLQNKFYQKKRALEMIVTSLEERRIQVAPKVMKLLKDDFTLETHLVSLSPRHHKFFEIQGEVLTEMIEKAEKETQTDLDLKDRVARYTVHYLPVKETDHEHSFSCEDLESVYEAVENFHSYMDIEEDSSYYNRSHDKSEFARYHQPYSAQDLFISMENELIEHYSKESDFSSWKAGVMLGLSKGREIGIKEVEEDIESIERANSLKQSRIERGLIDEEDDPEMQQICIFENESYDSADIFEDDKSPQKKIRRSKTERVILDNSPSIGKKSMRQFYKKNPNFVLKSIKRTTKFKEFNWHRKRDATYYNKKISMGNLILQNLFRKPLESIVKRGTISIRMLNRFISNVYQVCITKNKTDDINTLIEIAYEEIFNRYGLKAVADRKFVELVCSLFRFHKGKRKMFLKFIGAAQKLDSNNYSRFSLKLFLAMHHYLLNAKIGINVHTVEYADVVLLPAVRAIECLKEKVEPVLDKFEVNILQGWVERHSIADHKKINQNGVINMDKFLLQVIETYEIHQLNIYEGTFTMFQALMAESSQINNIELELLLRFVNRKKVQSPKKEEDYDPEHSAKLATPHIDMEYFSFEQFFSACIEKNLVNSKDIRKIFKDEEDPSAVIAREKDSLFEILNTMQERFDRKWRTLEPDLIKKRLLCLENSVGDIKDSLIYLGWSIYSLELNRIQEDYLSFE